MADRFDATGKIYELALDQNGSLIQVNKNGVVKPKTKIINQEGKRSHSLPIHLLKTAKYDMTLTRIYKDCPKCKCVVSIILRPNNTTFYICELCDHYEQV